MKSISVEDTFDADIADMGVLEAKVSRDAAVVAGRLNKAGLFARTVTVKIKLGDFTTHTRSRTLRGATAVRQASVGYQPGEDVNHDTWGAGWVWGSGHGWVTVRFETALSEKPGPVRAFRLDDPALRATPVVGPEAADPDDDEG